MNNVQNFILKNLDLLYHGNALDKLLAVGKLAVIPAVGTSIVEYLTAWYIDNGIFMGFILYTVVASAVLGGIVHVKKKDFSFKLLFWGFIIKLLAVIIGYVSFEMLHQIIKDLDIGGLYLKAVIQIMTLLYPMGSVAKSLYFITGGKFPPFGFMNKLKDFNKDLDINHFKSKKDETENINADSIE